MSLEKWNYSIALGPKMLFLYRSFEWRALKVNMIMFEHGHFLERNPVEYVIWIICQKKIFSEGVERWKITRCTERRGFNRKFLCPSIAFVTNFRYISHIQQGPILRSFTQ